MTPLLRDASWKVSHGLAAVYVEHNADPNGGAWTGFGDILAQIDAGQRMAAGPCIEPVDRWQHDQYRKFTNDVIDRNGERRPPGKLGLGALHVHVEVSGAAEVWE